GGRGPGASVTALRGASVRDALDSASIAIAASGSPTPRLDAELLLAHALDVDRTTLFLDPEREVGGQAVRAFQTLARRRSVEHAPVAYLLGHRGFRRLDLAVDPRVLIPRPETELLVEVGLELPRHARVVDVGTGSGAVALALKDERPDLDVVGTDASVDALAVARGNAARLRLDVAFAQGDLLAGFTADAILANPPYVADGAPLPPDVARHEPGAALYAGADGLSVIRRLVPAALHSDATLVAVEVGAGQAPAVAALARESGFADVATRTDLAGIERVVVARR
ncbi:MAG TPA: peptide chain release factor N(5)-glutamine methyltransferase, partial [Solirubrobacteraceae bacterium]|nr:peptide chain release factor N(5)-glutamine methyltransferase [Solirubrobacteraceae bacterium]